ncbi:MAG: acetamidase/formamidase family protein, partial [Candidatus Acidiferrales bacterium]
MKIPLIRGRGQREKYSVKRIVMFTVLVLPMSACAISLRLNAQQNGAAGMKGAAHYELKPTPKTVAWGYYDAKTPPVLHVKSGDSVEIQTLITSSPDRLEGAGVPPSQVEQSLRDIYKEVTNKGPGGHILTGPVFVDGAEPGDVLEIRIQNIRLAIPYAYNAFGP